MSMSYAKSALQRVLEMPEMLLPIFLELDVPDQFARVNRLFRETSQNYVNIAKHFEYRFYPFEIMAQFLPRVKLHKERLDLIALLLARGGLLSRDYLLVLSHWRLPEGAPPQEARYQVGYLHNGVHSTTIAYPTMLFLTEQSTFVRKLHLGQGEDHRKLMRLLRRQELRGRSLEQHREVVRTHVQRYGTGLYQRGQPLYELYSAILTHCHGDLDWHFQILIKEGGCPSMHDWDIFNLVMVSYTRAHMFSPNVLTPAAISWLWEHFRGHMWRMACEHFCSTYILDLGSRQADSEALLTDFLEPSSIHDAFECLAIQMLSIYTPVRLEYASARLQFARIWRRHLKGIKAYPDHLKHLRPRIDAAVLYLALTGEEKLKDMLAANIKVLSWYLYPASAVHLLSAPFHTPTSFMRALYFVSEKLKKKVDLERILMDAVDNLLGVHTSGLQILALADRYSWVVPHIVERLNPQNVHLVMEDPPFPEPYTDDPMVIGIRRAFSHLSQDRPQWLRATPGDGCIPLSIALLGLLKTKGNDTLELIYQEAKRRNKVKIVQAYEQAGFGDEVSDKEPKTASQRKRKRRFQRQTTAKRHKAV